jgi:hypothetical protein
VLPLEDSLRGSWAAEGEGAEGEVTALAPRQSGGEEMQSKVIAPGLAPLWATGATAAVNTFVREPRPSSPQESFSRHGIPVSSMYLPRPPGFFPLP